MLLRTTSRHSGEKLHLRKFCLIIISLVLVSIQIIAQNGWTKKADLKTPRGGACACVVDNKIYVVGGITGSPGYSDLAANEMYDPLTDTWTTKSPLPVARGYLSCAVVSGIIYAIGGGYPTAAKRVDAYDPATNTWTQKQDMLSVRRSAQACVVDGIIYNIGGNHGVDQPSPECEAYDPVTNTWTAKANMPAGGGNLAVTVYNGLIYVFGGSTYSPWAGFSHVYAYDPQTNTWATKKNMPTARFGLQAYTIGNKIYAIGGGQNGSSAISTLEVYYPDIDEWESRANMPFTSVFFAGAVVNNKIYVIGGSPDWATGAVNVWEYDPTFPTGVEQDIINPTEFVLYQNYPNPFNPATVISYQLAVSSQVTLKVYDVLGNEVATLVNEEKPAGIYEVTWNAANLSSGVYFYQLKAGSFSATKKLLLLK